MGAVNAIDHRRVVGRSDGIRNSRQRTRRVECFAELALGDPVDLVGQQVGRVVNWAEPGVQLLGGDLASGPSPNRANVGRILRKQKLKSGMKKT
jgi:hypothetical protein